MSRIRKYLPELVYGGVDGAVTTFAVVAGTVGASLSPVIILILGFANLFADGFSMAASNYLSSESSRHLEEGESFEKRLSFTRATATFTSFVFIGIIPLIPFTLEYLGVSFGGHTFLWSSIFTGFVFLVIGVVKGFVTKTNRFYSATTTVLIGGLAASISYFIGVFLKGLVG